MSEHSRHSKNLLGVLGSPPFLAKGKYFLITIFQIRVRSRKTGVSVQDLA